MSICTACGISVDLDLDGNDSAPKPQAPKVFMGDLKYEKAAVEILTSKGWLKPGQGLKDLTPDQLKSIDNHAFEQAVRRSAAAQ